MAFSKAHKFSPADFYLSRICFIFSHPARITIIRTLMHKEKCTVNKLSRDLPLSGASISQHLKILRKMHIVCCSQETPLTYYWLNKDLEMTLQILISMMKRSRKQKFSMGIRDLDALTHLRKTEANGI
jgi:DNA-binding transcriptional ArsR family regulator